MIRVARAIPLLAVLGLIYLWSPMFAWTAVGALAIAIAWRRVTASNRREHVSPERDTEATLHA